MKRSNLALAAVGAVALAALLGLFNFTGVRGGEPVDEGPTSIEVRKTADFDGRFVSGTISISNAGEHPAHISAIADSLEVHFPNRSDFTPPPLPEGSAPNWFKVAGVPVDAPEPIPVGEKVTIDYRFDLCDAADFSGANAMRNVVAVTLANRPDGAQTDTVVTRSESFPPAVPECPAATGSINGTVNQDNSGIPLEGICVEVFDTSFNFVVGAGTDANGDYSVDGLPAGDYYVQFVDCIEPFTHFTEWYDNSPDSASANVVTVEPGQKTGGVDALLAEPGSINGTLTDESAGGPLPDICVDVYTRARAFVGSDITDENGHYSVDDLRPGDYKVHFEDCVVPLTLFDEWYNDKPNFESADKVIVTGGKKTGGIDAALALGGTINGTVTEEGTNIPLENICVSGGGGWGYTDENGDYTMGPLETGDHKVEFYDCGSGTHLAEWYDDKPDRDSADPVAVTQGEKTAGIDAALTIGGFINGTVTEEGTAIPLEDIHVAVYDTSGGWTGSDHTDANGNYSLGPLRTGEYKVTFFDHRQIHFPEWYDDKPDFPVADPVSVTEGEKTAGIDAALTLAGSINGTVTHQDTGEPLAGICVDLVDSAGSSVRNAQTDQDGNYSVGYLRTGEYKVVFYHCRVGRSHPFEWYNDRPDEASADAVSVTVTQKTGGIDAALGPGSINGTVTDEDTGGPLAGICVDVESGFRHVATLVTDASGNYSVGGLPSTDYKVRFRDFGLDCPGRPTHLDEWYNDKPSRSSADLVTVTAKEKTANVDAALTLGGSINGRVTNEVTGDPLPGICVDGGGGGPHPAAVTDENGNYSVGALRTGDYRVRFSVCPGSPKTYIPEFYNDKPDRDSADLVPVTVGEKTGGIDAALTPTGSINGTVAEQGTGRSLDRICVTVFDLLNNYAGSDSTDKSGYYSVLYLWPGDYKVEFHDCREPQTHLDEWYNDKPDFASGDVVTVMPGQKTAGIDALLAEGTD